MLEPRKAFVENKDLSRNWIDVVDGKQFQEAVKAAMVQMLLEMPSGTDGSSALAAHFKMMGAREYLRMLMELTLPTTTARPPRSQNLDHSTLK